MFPPFLVSIVATFYMIKAVPGDETIKGYVRVFVVGLTAIWLIYIIAGALNGGPGFYPCGPYHRP
jgi:hypothetical protein